jgi:hypothetical protein
MELDDLKTAWNKFSSENEEQHKLPEENFSKILKKRTIDIADRIGRNIRIGIGIILGWILLGFAFDFVATPLFDKILDKPYLEEGFMLWAFVAETIIYLLIFTAIVIFWLRYKKIEKTEFDHANLKSRVTQLINMLNSYKRMFYVLLGIVLLYAVAAFSSGFIMEYSYQLQQKGIDHTSIDFGKKVVIALTFIISISIILAIYFLLFQLFFKRLYGKYLKQLNNTLLELNEPEIHTK